MRPEDEEIDFGCLPRSLCAEGFLSGLSLEAQQAFEAICVRVAYLRGESLFDERSVARGIYLIRSGRVRLRTRATRGKVFRVVGQGEVLGLSAAISSSAHQFTAEAVGRCEVDFVRRGDFLRYLVEHVRVCLRLIECLSKDYRDLHMQAILSIRDQPEPSQSRKLTAITIRE